MSEEVSLEMKAQRWVEITCVQGERKNSPEKGSIVWEGPMGAAEQKGADGQGWRHARMEMYWFWEERDSGPVGLGGNVDVILRAIF